MSRLAIELPGSNRAFTWRQRALVGPEDFSCRTHNAYGAQTALPLRRFRRPLVTSARRVEQPHAKPPRRQAAPSHKKQQASADDSKMWSALVSRISKALALFGAAAAVTFLAASPPAEAARSGGRIGGSSFSSRSAPFSGSSRDYMGSRSATAAAAAGSFGQSPFSHRMGASTMIAPHRSSVSTNVFFFSPFGFGGGYGYPMGYGGGLTSLLFWVAFAFIAAQVARGVMGQRDDSMMAELDAGDRVTVAKLQVGLLSSARDLQRDLERIASRADTSTSSGLHYVLQETVLSLLRNPDYAVYGFGKSGVERSADDAEARFNKLSLEERGKFERETRVNVSGRRSTGTTGLARTVLTPVSELIVVTILVATEGRLRLPKVTDRESLIDALTTLGGLPASTVLAVEVLWTPEEEDDYFTMDDIAKDYPMLNTL
jgi:uncharacterized membrane protein